MGRFLAIVALSSSVCACAPSSHAGARKSVIPTPPVFEDDTRTDRIGVRTIWIAYAGAEGAASTVARTRDDAHQRADMVAGVAQMAGESFPELVAKYSDRPSVKSGGGPGAELVAGNGLLPPKAEVAAFRLAIGEVSGPVDTPQGFVIVIRTATPAEIARTPGLGETKD